MRKRWKTGQEEVDWLKLRAQIIRSTELPTMEELRAPVAKRLAEIDAQITALLEELARLEFQQNSE